MDGFWDTGGMEAAHPWGFDPNQPGVQALRKARAYAQQGEVEVEITAPVAYVRFIGRYVALGERVRVPTAVGNALTERGAARRSAESS